MQSAYALMLGLLLVMLPTHADVGHSHLSQAAHWMAPETERNRPNPAAPTAASLARGRKIFDANCASCHGPQGRGDGPVAKSLTPKPSNLPAMAGEHSDGDLAWKIATGRGPMPGWKNSLSQADIWDTVNYVRSLAKRRVGPATKPAPADHQH